MLRFKKLASTFLAAAFIVSGSTGVLASSHYPESGLGEQRVINHPILGTIYLSGEYVTERVLVEDHDEYGNLLHSEYFYIDVPIEEIALGELLAEQGNDSANERWLDMFPIHFTANSGRNRVDMRSGTNSVTISFSSQNIGSLHIYARSLAHNAYLSNSGQSLGRGVRRTFTPSSGTINWTIYARNSSVDSGSANFVSH